MAKTIMMLIATFVSALLFGSIGVASSSTTSTAPAPTHTISVGGSNGYNFVPSQVNASVGDIIEFRFYPQNHSVARAAFGPNPCIPYEYSGDGRVGFWSGFKPTALVLNDPPIFQLPINDTEPVFFYCSAPDACFQGMVGVINPNATFTFAAQFLYTQNTTMEFSPMESIPVEALPSRTTTATGMPTVVPTTSNSSPAATTTAAGVPPSSPKSTLGTGPIVGIAIGGFAVVVLVIALVYMCGRQKTVNEILNRHSMAPLSNNTYRPSTVEIAEAQYPNIAKSPGISNDGRFSGYGSGPDNDSYRSMSPPIDERTSFMRQQHRHQGIISPGSPGFPSPTYEAHEMENTHSSTGLSPYLPAYPQRSPTDQGPHEMAVPSRNPSASSGARDTSARPFSYTDNEADFTAEPHRQEDVKGEVDDI